jgi:hypothetical protein
VVNHSAAITEVEVAYKGTSWEVPKQVVEICSYQMVGSNMSFLWVSVDFSKAVTYESVCA